MRRLARAIPWVAAFGAWQLLATIIDQPTAVPTPSAIAGGFARDLPLYAVNFGPTLSAAAAGYALGNLAAIFTAIAVATLRPIRREASLVVVALYNVPVIVVAPVLEVVLPGAWPLVALAALSVYFTTLLATLGALDTASERLSLDVVRAAGGGALAALSKVRLWYALPDVAAALAIGVPLATVGAMVGEFLGGQTRGLGVMLLQALNDIDAPRVWGIALAVGGLGYGAVALSDALTHRIFPWGRGIGTATLPAWPLDPGASGRAIVVVVRALRAAALAALVLLGLWVAAIEVLRLPPYLARTPGDVWRYLTAGPGAAVNRAALLSALVTSLARALLGCLIGIVLGIALAAAGSVSRAMRRATTPLVVLVGSMPFVALVPILTLALGRGPVIGVAVGALISLLPTVRNVAGGLGLAPAALRDVVRTAGGGRWRALAAVELPAAVPAIFVSLRIAAPWALYGVLLSEWLATGGGLGSVLVQSSVAGNLDEAWSAAVVVSVASLALYLLADALAAWALRVARG